MKAKKNYLTPAEVQRLLEATKQSFYPDRNFLLLFLMYRHGFRVSELINLKTQHVDLESKELYIHRSKGGLSTTHPLMPDECKLIKAYLKNHAHKLFFVSERGKPFTRQAINYLCSAIGKLADLKVNPHMLRHSCGYKLANEGHDVRLIQAYLGHTDIQSTVRYTTVNAQRFKELWK